MYLVKLFSVGYSLSSYEAASARYLRYYTLIYSKKHAKYILRGVVCPSKLGEEQKVSYKQLALVSRILLPVRIVSKVRRIAGL